MLVVKDINIKDIYNRYYEDVHLKLDRSYLQNENYNRISISFGNIIWEGFK